MSLMSELPYKLTMTNLAQRYAMRGLTLFEMIIVMSIVAILTMIAIPSYQYVTTSNRMASEINGLLGDLQFARSEAIKEGATVSACVSTNGTTCATSNAWNSGWIILSSNSTTPLRAQNPFTGTDTLTANNAISTIQFNREGFAAGLPNGALITLHAATPSAATTRCLTITLIGLMLIEPYKVGSCT
jgi:type IV fimbrial biogenesis protein FimT